MALEIEGFVEGLEMIDPGVISVSRWRPEEPGEEPAEVDAFGGVGRKP